MNWSVIAGIALGIFLAFSVRSIRYMKEEKIDKEPNVIYGIVPLLICLAMLYFGWRFKGSFAIAFFFTNIFVSIFSISHYAYVKTNKIREKRDREEKIRKDDLKYNLIINCPKCAGTGNVIIKTTLYKDRNILNPHDNTYGYWNHKSSVHGPAYDGWRNNYKDKYVDENFHDPYIAGELSEGYEEAKCSFCKSKGTAYAYFENTTEKCYKCNGTGKIKKKETLKLDIGVEEKEAQIICSKCDGKGHNEATYCHVKSSRDDSKSVSVFKELITDKNREFYSKSKPRYS